MKIFRKICIILMLLTATLFSMALQVFAAPEPETLSEAVLLVETGTGKVLYEKNKDVPLDGASLVKIMTVLLAAEAIEDNIISLDDSVVITDDAWADVSSDSINVNLRAGEEIHFRDLLYCTLMTSANEASNAIAIHVAGSIEAFVDMMNDRAKELGCGNTRFANTHGLTNGGQYISAWDAYLILSAAISYPIFEEIFGETRHVVAATNISGQRVLNTTNKLLLSDSEYYCANCTGGKTGNTINAGSCLAATADNSDLSLVSVIIGSAGDGSYVETKSMFEWGFQNFAWKTIISPDTVIRTENALMGDNGGKVKICPAEPLSLLLDISVMPSDFEREIVLYAGRDGADLLAPVSVGDVLGEMTLYLHGTKCGSVKLVSASNVELMRTAYVKMALRDALSKPVIRIVIAAVALMFAAYLAYAVCDHINRVKRKKELNDIKRRLIEERMSGMQPMGGVDYGTSRDFYGFNDEFEPQEEFVPDSSFKEVFAKGDEKEIKR